MPLITWDETLSVKVKQIDLQHQQLISIINELNEAMKQGKGKLVLGKILSELIDYTAIHFKTEEKYFRQFGYAETDEHMKEHANLLKQVVELKTKFDSGSFALSVKLMVFLRDWLRDHILITDMKYTDFFNENGIS